MGYHGQSEPSALSAPMPIFPAQHLVVAVVRGGVEPPTFRFSALGIPVVMLARVDAIDADIAALDGKIEEMIAPFTAAAQRLDEIPGINAVAACVILAEIGIDMDRFPTAGHLVSWAKFAPGVKESAGKKKGKNTTGHGDSYLARVLGNAAVSAGRTDTFLGDRY